MEDIEVKVTTPLSGLTGGSNNGYNGSSDNKSSIGKAKKKKKEKVRIPTFKYCFRFRGKLHEAILLNDEPMFLTYSDDDGQIRAVKQIEEINRILVPPGIEEYPYEPIEFESIEEVNKSVQRAKNESIDTLYQNIRNIVSLYVDQEEEIQILISADILWTYFQDLFSTTHYYDVIGRGNGIGKSSIGFIFEGIAYRTVRMTNPSAANLYRVLERIEAGQCTIVADEADNIHEDRYMMAILKEGYAIGGRVPKINMNTGKQEWFFSYGFKIRIAEDPLSPGTARGLIDRMFQIKAIKGKPEHDIKEVLHPANRDKTLERLHNDLRELRKLLLVYRLIHFEDPIVNRDVGLEGRDKELCKPLLQLFHGSKAHNEVQTVSRLFLDNKNKRKKNTSIDPVLYEITVNLVSDYGVKLYNSAIWQAIQDKIPGAPIDVKKPNEYQSYEYDTIYRRTALNHIEGFGAEPDRDHKGRFLKFDIHRLAKTAKQFDGDSIGIQSRLELANPNSHRHIVTSSRPENDINITRNAEEDKEIANRTVESNGKVARDDVTMVTMAESIYRISSTDQFGCNGCKLKGDKWFMQGHNCKGTSNCSGDGNGKSHSKNKSKRDAMVEANMSGNGLVGDKQAELCRFCKNS